MEEVIIFLLFIGSTWFLINNSLSPKAKGCSKNCNGCEGHCQVGNQMADGLEK